MGLGSRATRSRRATPICGVGASCCPSVRTDSIVSLGEIETPLIPIPRSGGGNVLVKDEGRLPTGSFKARAWSWPSPMARELGVTRIAMPNQRQCGRGAGRLCRALRDRDRHPLPGGNAKVNVREIAAQGARVWRVNGQIDECGAIVGRGAAEGRWFDFSTLKEPYRIEGKKTMGWNSPLNWGGSCPMRSSIRPAAAPA